MLFSAFREVSSSIFRPRKQDAARGTLSIQEGSEGYLVAIRPGWKPSTKLGGRAALAQLALACSLSFTRLTSNEVTYKVAKRRGRRPQTLNKNLFCRLSR